MLAVTAFPNICDIAVAVSEKLIALAVGCTVGRICDYVAQGSDPEIRILPCLVAGVYHKRFKL